MNRKSLFTYLGILFLAGWTIFCYYFGYYSGERDAVEKLTPTEPSKAEPKEIVEIPSIKEIDMPLGKAVGQISEVWVNYDRDKVLIELTASETITQIRAPIVKEFLDAAHELRDEAARVYINGGVQ